MKSFIIFVLKCIGKIIAILYPYSCSQRCKFIRDKIYTYWITANFKKYANSSIFIYPVTIIGGKYISVGERVYMGARSILSAWDKYEDDVFNPQIMIGDGVGIGEDSHITAINRIEIGRDVLMGKKVTITDNSHGKTEYEQLSIPPKKRVLYSKGPVVIEDRVWIGDKVTILPNVRIGKNAIIAANAVITSDIPENCIAGGNPAKIIKKITV